MKFRSGAFGNTPGPQNWPKKIENPQKSGFSPDIAGNSDSQTLNNVLVEAGVILEILSDAGDFE